MKTAAALFALVLAPPVCAEVPLAVEIVRVGPSTSGYEFSLTGTTEAANLFPAAFRTGGRVISVSVETGDRVAAGTELARIDPTQQREALRAAQAARQSAEAGLVRAQQDYNRQQALLDRGTVTQADFDVSREALVTAEAAHNQAEAQVSKAQRALDDTVLAAPEDAIVTRREAEPGQVVGAAQTIVMLADRVARDAVFLAPDGAPIENFLGAEIRLDLIERDAPPLKAHLTEVSPVVDSRTGSVAVRARIDNPPPDIPLLGEPVEGSLTIPAAAAAVVPWTALTVADGQMAVWTVEPATGIVALTPITVERYTNESVLVSAGLEEGALVVAEGSQMLFPGRKVRDRSEGAQ